MSLFTDLKEVLTPYAQRIKGLAAADEKIKADLGDKVGVIGSVKGYYINLTTDPVSLTPQVSSGRLSCSIVDCVEGDVFVVNAVGASSGRAWGFLDSSNHVLSMADANATVENLELTAPTNAVKLIINDKGGGISYKADSNLVSRVAALEKVEPGLSAEAKTALIDLVSHIGIWTDGNGKDYVDAFVEALTGEYPTIKVFIGKGTSGASLVDNEKRAITEPIPFTNTIPITIQRTAEGVDDGYRASVKWMVDDSTVWVPPSGDNHRLIPLDAPTGQDAGWIYTASEKTWSEKIISEGQTYYVPVTFTDTNNGTLRILFAPYAGMSEDLPENPPQGFLIVQGKKYRLEVGDNEDFV